MILLSAEYRVRVIQLPAQTSYGCTGHISWYYEGRLEYRTELNLQREATDATPNVSPQAD